MTLVGLADGVWTVISNNYLPQELYRTALFSFRNGINQGAAYGLAAAVFCLLLGGALRRAGAGKNSGRWAIMTGLIAVPPTWRSCSSARSPFTASRE